ncbi:MAG: hypothetical protein Q8O40_08125 [Chloroflexota bacterium]|nr:hypothetical protein [Chloroflexota bacterium]
MVLKIQEHNGVKALQTLQTIAIPPLAPESVIIAVFDHKDGSIRMLDARNFVEALAAAERIHVIGKLDERDRITVTVPAGSAIGTVVAAELLVPAGEVWFLNMVHLTSPGESAPAVGDVVQVNFKNTSWPLTGDVAGKTFFATNQGGAAPGDHYAEFHPFAPLFATINLSCELRLEAGKKLTLVGVLTGAIAGAALVATLEPFGWKGKLLVS